jgi:putative ABC transport system permease protein
LNTTIKQISAAIVISVPLAYYLTQQYLQKFSERIALQWWHYALPVAMIILILLSTVATVVWRAAKSNPVEALKYE